MADKLENYPSIPHRAGLTLGCWFHVVRRGQHPEPIGEPHLVNVGVCVVDAFEVGGKERLSVALLSYTIPG